MTPDPEPLLPVFIPEWSVWDTVITRHYDSGSTTAKDFMYELALKNVDRSAKLSVIPDELSEVLDSAFSDRPAFSFLLENCASREGIPNILTRTIHDKIPHRVAVVLMGFWKSLNFPEVYIVTEDKGLNEEVTAGLSQMGINLAHLQIISSAEAIKILRDKCP